MSYLSLLPVWNKLEESHRRLLETGAYLGTFGKKEIIYAGSTQCTGLILVLSGQLRVYTPSPEGREVTLYRLFERDICLFSASCMLNSIQFELTVSAEKDTEALIIPADVYKSVMEVSAPLANYTNELMASRFSEVMWLVEQVMWKSFDKRLAEFLLNESVLENSLVLRITHEEVGNHLGSPREVVTRMLKYFVSEGLVRLSRGVIEITDKKRLLEI